MKKNFQKFLNKYLLDLSNSIKQSNINELEKVPNKILETIKKNGTIYVCGNGGSAAIANHYVCDYSKFLRQHSKLKPKVISLSNNMEIITAISNDISYDEIFKYQAENLFEKNDLLIIISSSGNSKNIIRVLDYANKIKVKSIGFCSFKGGYVKKNCTIPIYSKINNYGISEDVNHILMHSMMQSIKLRNLKKNIKKPII